MVESFKAWDVKNVFWFNWLGYSWNCLMPSYDNNKIRFIGVRDERTGTHMADGYARASGKPGIIVAGQNGPGATNLITGVCASCCGFFLQLFSIAGCYFLQSMLGKNAFQEIDQQALFEPITKKDLVS